MSERAEEGPMRLNSSDAEPVVDTVVRDVNGWLWRRSSVLREGRCWVRADGVDDDPETWVRVAGNNGPVEVVQ